MPIRQPPIWKRRRKALLRDFDGIISGIKTAAGSRVEKGSELFTIQSSSAVQVTVELSKYDLEKGQRGTERDGDGRRRFLFGNGEQDQSRCPE